MSRLEKTFVIGVVVVLGVATWLFTSAFVGADESALAEADPTLSAHEESSTAPRRVVGEAPARIPTIEAAEAVVADEAVVLPPLENRITGTVSGPEGPVVGASVVSALYFPHGEPNYGLLKKHDATATTRDDGTFALEVPGHGAYRVTVADSVHSPAIRELVRAGDDLAIELRPGARLDGIVRSKLTKKPVGGAAIMISAESDEWEEKITVGDDGVFSFAGLPTSALELTVTRDDHVRFEKRLDFDEGAAESLVIDLDPGRVIHGIVEDESGVWIEGATVGIGDREALTDDLGRFRITGLGQRLHQVKAEAEGFLSTGLSVNLAGSRLEAEIALVVHPGGTVSGTIIDDTGKAVAEASVKVFRTWGRGNSLYDTGESRLQCRSDADGRFKITGLEANRWTWYSVRVVKDGFAESYSEKFRLEKNDESKEIAIVMRSGGVIAGSVLDQQQRPIAGAKVTLNPARVYEWNRDEAEDATATTRETLTGDDGKFSFSRLGKGTFRVSALARGYASRFSTDIKIEAEEAHEGVDLTLARGGRIVGKVTSTDGEPIANARLWFYSKSSWAQGRSGADGGYVVHDVLEGTFTATIRAEGFRYKRENDAVAIDGRLDFRLDPNGAVTGVVTDASSGELIEGATIELISAAENGRRARTRGRATSAADGTFAVHASDGTYVLRARKGRYIDWERTDISLSAGAESEPHAIKLSQGGAIEGWVRDHLGDPVAGAEVYVRSAVTSNGAETFKRSGRTEKDGYFFVGSLGTGSYIVATRTRGRSSIHRRRNVNVFAGEIAETSFAFLPPTHLHVALVDDRGIPLSRQTVRVRHSGRAPIELVSARNDRGDRVYQLAGEKSYRTSRAGTIDIHDLPDGRYELSVQRKRHVSTESVVTLQEGSGSTVTMTVAREGARPNAAGSSQ